MSDKEYVELEEMLIATTIPKGACRVDMTFTMLDDNGEVYTVVSTMDTEDIRMARDDYLRVDPDDGVKYVFSDLFKAYMEDDEGMDWEEYRDAYGAKGD